jgi:hypothetical protein
VEREPDVRLPAWCRLGAAALYGAALGSWRGAEQALFAALKLPLVLALTWLLTVPFQGILSWSFGRRSGLREIAARGFEPLADAGLLLAALSPVALLFVQSTPPPPVGDQTAHNLLFVLHTATVGAAGAAGVARFAREVRAEIPSARRRRRFVTLWLAAYALVGGEVAWAFRPFVGSVHHPIEILRDRPLDGNVYEFLWHDVAPHLERRLLGLPEP